MRKDIRASDTTTSYYFANGGAAALAGVGPVPNSASVRCGDSPTNNDGEKVPLCVDLDHTFMDTDLLIESFLVLIKKNPLYVFMCFFWLLKSKAWLKMQIADRVAMDIAVLPYNAALLSYLREQKAQGRSLFLCTAANCCLAQKVADHFGIFDGVMASNDAHNLSGKNKAEALVDRFGAHGFDYCGDTMTDIPVWVQSRRAIVVGNKRIAAAAAKVNGSIVFFEKERALLQLIAKEMRVYQWVKNLLIFVPLLASHRFTDVPSILRSHRVRIV